MKNFPFFLYSSSLLPLNKVSYEKLDSASFEKLQKAVHFAAPHLNLLNSAENLTFLKYLLRATTRPFPFGLFSAVSFGTFAHQNTQFNLDGSEEIAYLLKNPRFRHLKKGTQSPKSKSVALVDLKLPKIAPIKKLQGNDENTWSCDQAAVHSLLYRKNAEINISDTDLKKINSTFETLFGLFKNINYSDSSQSRTYSKFLNFFKLNYGLKQVSLEKFIAQAENYKSEFYLSEHPSQNASSFSDWFNKRSNQFTKSTYNLSSLDLRELKRLDQNFGKKNSLKPPDDYFSGSMFLQHTLDRSPNFYFRFAVTDNALSMLSRFLGDDIQINHSLKEMATAQASHLKGMIVAEIVKQTSGKASYVQINPQFYEHEIQLSKSKIKNKDISISDLLLSIKDNRFLLSSKKFRCEVAPQLSNAVMFEFDQNLLFKFLGTVAAGRRPMTIKWDWRNFPDSNHYPRMVLEGVVLSPQMWKIPAAQVLELLQSNNYQNDIQKFVEKFRISPNVMVEELGIEVFIDLRNQFHLQAAQKFFSNKNYIVFKEYIPEITDFQTTQSSHSNCIWLPYYKVPTKKKLNNPKRKFSKMKILKTDRSVKLEFQIDNDFIKFFLGKLVYDFVKQVNQKVSGLNWFYSVRTSTLTTVELHFEISSEKNTSNLLALNSLLKNTEIKKFVRKFEVGRHSNRKLSLAETEICWGNLKFVHQWYNNGLLRTSTVDLYLILMIQRIISVTLIDFDSQKSFLHNLDLQRKTRLSKTELIRRKYYSKLNKIYRRDLLSSIFERKSSNKTFKFLNKQFVAQSPVHRRFLDPSLLNSSIQQAFDRIDPAISAEERRLVLITLRQLYITQDLLQKNR